MTAPRYSSTWKPTVAQLRILNEVRRKPGRKYDGRARKPIERLAAQGLVRYDYDLISACGSLGFNSREQYRVYPVEGG